MKVKFCFAFLCLVAFSPIGKSSAQTSPSQDDARSDAQSELHVLAAGNMMQTAIAFSPRENIVATGGFESVVKLWDVTTGQLIRSLTTSQQLVHTLQFSPDGKMLAIGGKQVQLWDVSSGKLKFTLGNNKQGPRKITCLCFSRDGQILAVASGLGNYHVQLWNMRTGNWFRNGISSITRSHVQFSPREDLLLTFSRFGWEFINIKTNKRKEFDFGELRYDIHCIAFAPDGKTLAIGGDTPAYKEGRSFSDYSGFTGEIHICEVKTGRLLKRLKHRESRTNSLAFSPDGRSLAVGHSEKVRIWSTRTWQLRQEKELLADAVRYSHDGKTLGFISFGTPTLWRVRDWSRGNLGVKNKSVSLPASALKALDSKLRNGV